MLAVTVVATSIVTGCWRMHGAREGWTEIEGSALAAEIAARRDTLTIVDVREPALFQAGHLPGAINRPFTEVKARPAAAFEPGQNLVFVCHGGPMGAELAESLAARHYPRVRNLAGGMARWNGPIERSP
jgi:rhodanese-related sulfurtransferase